MTIAGLWAIVNACRVYFVLNGSRMFLLESAVILFAAVSVAATLLNRREPRPFLEQPPASLAVVCVLSIGLFLSLYLGLLTFPFLSDDYVFVRLYRHLGDVTLAPQFFRPLFAAVFLVCARIGGGASWPFHVLSLLLHGACAIVVYALGRQLFGVTCGFVAFSMFLLNPLQLEAVLWVSGVQELLWSFFALMALRVYLDERAPTWGQVALTATMIAAALLSKETAICLVLLLPAADLAFYGLKRGPLQVRTYLALAAVVAAYLGVRSYFAAPPDNLAVPTMYFLKQMLATPYRFFAQPWNAAAVPVPPTLAGLIALMWLAALMFVGLRRRPPVQLLFAPAVVLISVLPLQRYFFVAADLTASRYVYFAYAGWALLVGGLVQTAFRDRPRWCAAVTAILAMASAVLLYGNVRPWQTVGQLLNDLERTAARGAAPETAIVEWQAARGVTLNMRHQLPWDFQGVPIFINGYPEFLAIAAERRLSDPH
jgi:hypothetical protein